MTNIQQLLTKHGIHFSEAGNGEIKAHCVFNDCDKDSQGDEAHLYINEGTGVYKCFKCGAEGNERSLLEKLGEQLPAKSQKAQMFNADIVEQCHKAMPQHIREYLNKRGISNEVIDARKLGYGRFYREWWITIPVKDAYGAYAFFKLRQDPRSGNKKHTYPKSTPAHPVEAQMYEWDTLRQPDELLVICEGELDCLHLQSKGIRAVTGTAGAETFKEHWIPSVRRAAKRVYISYDADDTGKRGAEKVARMIEGNGAVETHIVSLPEISGEKVDVTDYFVKYGGTVEDLFGKLARPYPERIDTSKFMPMTREKLLEILSLTIKRDDENKLATFLCLTSAYTDDAQFNISNNAPSSTGKSYIPTEEAKLFPREDVLEISYCSPTAFFHDAGEYDKEKNQFTVNLERKILIFLDQPHNDLLARLRPLLSHDKKEILLKITDKSQKGGLKTKNILMRGYPSVVFCTAGLQIDEQEATRFLLLSPQTSQEKILRGIETAIKKEAGAGAHEQALNANPERALLIERIRAIKLERISEIRVPSEDRIKARFLKGKKNLKPRHQRDVKRVMALIKAFALLNLWWRERDGSTITASEEDINSAFELWEPLSKSQELNLPPYVLNMYEDIFVPAWKEKRPLGSGTLVVGLSRNEIRQKHQEIYGRTLGMRTLTEQILPMLETAGLIVEETDPDDGRQKLAYPATPIFDDSDTKDEGNNSNGGGVKGNIHSGDSPFPSPGETALPENPADEEPVQLTLPFTYVDTPSKLNDALPALLSAPVLGLDIETTGLDAHMDRIRLVQLSTAERVFVVDTFKLDVKMLAPIFAGQSILVGHNLKFDLGFLLATGLSVSSGARLFDTLLVDQLLRGSPVPRGLADVVKENLAVVLDKSQQKSDWGGTLTPEMFEYAAKDASVLIPLYEKLKSAVEKSELDSVALLEHRALPAIVWMEHSGTPIDTSDWKNLSETALAESQRLADELTTLTGKQINWNSNAQTLAALRDGGVDVDNTREETLYPFRNHEIVRRLLKYRTESKRVSTYGEKYLKNINQATLRIHPDWRQIGAASGRMACSKPNLQNIPRDTTYRSCFRGKSGRMLVKADYSQIELRIAAEITRDEHMLGAYKRSDDLHTLTARLILGKDAPTKDDRQAAKAINFGLLYGMGANTLRGHAANNYGVQMSQAEAQKFRNRFFATYTGLRKWHRRQRDGTETIHTLSGRKRFGVDRFTEKLNTPVQGTGADGLKAALALLWETRNRCPSASPVLAVHDEIVVECDEADAERVKSWLVESMAKGMGEYVRDVPVAVDATITRDWGGFLSPHNPPQSLGVHYETSTYN